MPALDESTSDPPPAKLRNVVRATALEIVVVLPPLSRFGGRTTGLVAVGLSLRAIVASFAGAAFFWRLATAFCVVVVVERVGWVVELACLVVGEPGGATVGRVWEDRHAVVVAGGWRARRGSGVGLLLGGQRRTVPLSLFDRSPDTSIGSCARRGARPPLMPRQDASRRLPLPF